MADADRVLREKVRRACAVELPDAFDKLAFAAGIEAWMQAVFACNAYVDEQAPWALRKTDPARMGTVLYVLAETIRRLAILTQPLMPDASAKILEPLDDG